MFTLLIDLIENRFCKKGLTVWLTMSTFSLLLVANSGCFSHRTVDYPGSFDPHPVGGSPEGDRWGSGEDHRTRMTFYIYIYIWHLLCVLWKRAQVPGMSESRSCTRWPCGFWFSWNWFHKKVFWMDAWHIIKHWTEIISHLNVLPNRNVTKQIGWSTGRRPKVRNCWNDLSISAFQTGVGYWTDFSIRIC